MKKIFILTIIILNLTLASCGTIFYSERNFMERSTRVDYFVLGLDLMGLFLIVPGILALTIDSYTGALWLTPMESAAYFEENLEPSNIRDIVFK